jgi:hypothetical protein
MTETLEGRRLKGQGPSWAVASQKNSKSVQPPYLNYTWHKNEVLSFILAVKALDGKSGVPTRGRSWCLSWEWDSDRPARSWLVTVPVSVQVHVTYNFVTKNLWTPRIQRRFRAKRLASVYSTEAKLPRDGNSCDTMVGNAGHGLISTENWHDKKR